MTRFLKYILCGGFIALTVVVARAGLIHAQSLTLRVENDMPAGDGGYTNGFRYDLTLPNARPFWFKPIESQLTEWLNRSCAGADFCWKKQSLWSVGQTFFTPGDIVNAAPIPDDHPFAGWLYVSSMLTLSRQDSQRADIQLTAGLDLGVAGPSSLAEDLQVWWHTSFNRRPPNGWSNGVDDRIGIIVTGDAARSIPKLLDGAIGLSGQLHGGFRVGNMVNSIHLGLPLRFGFNPPSNVPSPIINSTFVGMEPRAASGERRKWALYLSAMAEAKLVTYDYLIDGSTLTDVTSSPAVVDFGIGIAGRLGPVEAGVHTVARSPEFRPYGTWQEYNSALLTLVL